MLRKAAIRALANVKRVGHEILQVALLSSKTEPSKNKVDIVVVGGGIVGCATAREIAERYPHLKVAIVEKEDRLAVHQSSRNSGVIHAGIYYTPGSLKAKLCVRGLNLAYEYLDKKKLPYKKCGKLIVAVEESELAGLQQLFERGKLNGTRDIQVIDGADIPKYEPHCRGLKAVWSPHTGIVDWGIVTKQLGEDLIGFGGQVITNFRVDKFELNEQSASSKSSTAYPLSLFSSSREIRCKYAIACGGLYSDHIAVLSGCSPEPKIVPIRGEYLALKPEKRYLVRGNIYPVPHPGLPFLGVHFTPRMDGNILLGPNAVLAFRREGYGYFDFNAKELFESLSYRGLQKLAVKHFAYGVSEFYRGIFIRGQVKQLQRYIPSLSFSDVTRGLTGVRAQALDSGGNLIDDFVFDYGTGDLGSRILHTRNAPSPAATSSLAIAELIADKAAETFSL
uniref:L-2-hydroxyglutarate dehydrogenase, mitochondrial n=1 Tax=Trichuris muris TaxID=70415 RepID=A0A5S6QJ88_TRIMR